MPFTGGGVNWGGLAVDGAKGVVYVNSSNMLHRITLFPASDYAEMKKRFHDKEVSPQRGAPYGMMRELLVSPLGLPCNPPPWGVLTALDLGSRKILWRAPLGTTEELNPLGLARRIGTPTFGGPLATASGLVFIGAALDDYLRAFDAKTRAALDRRLPSAGIATPTSYLWQGRQYVVIGAGGHGEARAPAGDTLVAFACRAPAISALRPGSAGSTGRAGASSCMPGWREPSRSRWRRCGCGGGEGVTGCRPEQPRRTRIATPAQPIASALNHEPLYIASFLLSAMAPLDRDADG